MNSNTTNFIHNNEKILLVDDDESFCFIMQRAFTRRNIHCDIYQSTDKAIEAMKYTPYSKAIVDLKIAQDSGLVLIKTLKILNPEICIIMLTGYSSVSTAVEAIKLGALNYLCKPVDIDEILHAFDETALDEVPTPPTLPPSLDRLEWEHIQKTLLAHNGNISATARELGMHRRTLQRKLTKRPTTQ